VDHLFICFLVSTLFFWDFRFLVFFFAIALFFVFSSGIRWNEMARAWLFIGGFILFFSFLTFLTGRGGMELYTSEHSYFKAAANFTLLGWRPTLNFTAERTMYALSMLLRVFSIASMTILIPYSLNPAHYGITFRGLGMPDKIAYGMDLTMRFIPTFGRDFSLTMDAQKARGYEVEKLSGGIFAQVRKLAPLIVPVTIQAIAGSEDIIDAMDLRAFGIWATHLAGKLTYHKRDRALIVAGIVILAVSVALSMYGVGKFWVPAFLIP